MKSIRKATVFVFGLLAFALSSSITLYLVGCSSFRGLKDRYPSDNPLEEFTERIIENETGLDIDLSPWDEDAEENKKEDDSG